MNELLLWTWAGGAIIAAFGLAVWCASRGRWVTAEDGPPTFALSIVGGALWPVWLLTALGVHVGRRIAKRREGDER